MEARAMDYLDPEKEDVCEELKQLVLELQDREKEVYELITKDVGECNFNMHRYGKSEESYNRLIRAREVHDVLRRILFYKFK